MTGVILHDIESGVTVQKARTFKATAEIDTSLEEFATAVVSVFPELKSKKIRFKPKKSLEEACFRITSR